MKANYLSN